MDQQVLREMIELISGSKIEFSDLTVRNSPHSFPHRITQVAQDYKNVYVTIDGEVLEWMKLNEKEKNTIIQRLRLLISKRQ